ncbi:hypothetical protein ACQPW3_06470 [Actinosynnema sp. CA-248983]
MIASGGFLGYVLVVSVIVLFSPDQVGSKPGLAFAILVLSGFFTVSWRGARAGVHVGPRGVLLYHVTRRAEVVPWDEVVRFEAHPLRLAGVPVEGAAIYLVGPAGDLRETMLKRSVGSRWDRAAYSWLHDVVVPAPQFVDAADRLNQAVRAFT